MFHHLYMYRSICHWHNNHNSSACNNLYQNSNLQSNFIQQPGMNFPQLWVHLWKFAPRESTCNLLAIWYWYNFSWYITTWNICTCTNKANNFCAILYYCQRYYTVYILLFDTCNSHVKYKLLNIIILLWVFVNIFVICWTSLILKSS